MEISKIQNLLKIYGKDIKSNNVRPKPEVSSSGRISDDVVISGEGKLKQKAIQIAKQSEDVRKDKVEQLKQAIATDSYEVSEDEVAESIIYQALLDKLV